MAWVDELSCSMKELWLDFMSDNWNVKKKLLMFYTSWVARFSCVSVCVCVRCECVCVLEPGQLLKSEKAFDSPPPLFGWRVWTVQWHTTTHHHHYYHHYYHLSCTRRGSRGGKREGRPRLRPSLLEWSGPPSPCSCDGILPHN